jgi:hypothetical protein
VVEADLCGYVPDEDALVERQRDNIAAQPMVVAHGPLAPSGVESSVLGSVAAYVPRGGN